MQYCYGLEIHGRLGCREDGSVESATEVEDVWHTEGDPMRVRFRLYPNVQILCITCGGDHTARPSSGAQLYSFGMNNDGQLARELS